MLKPIFATKAAQLITLLHIMNDERQKVGRQKNTKTHTIPAPSLFQKHGHLTRKHTGACNKKTQLHRCKHVTTPIHTCIKIKVHHVKSWQQCRSSPHRSIFFLSLFFFCLFHLSISSVNCLSKAARRRSEPGI